MLIKMKRIALLIILLIPTYILQAQSDLINYPNLLIANHFPDDSSDKPEYLASQGLWHGYTVPDTNDTENFGKFGGPYCLKTNKWISPSLLQFNFGVPGKGNIPLATAEKSEISQIPGMLYQKFTFKDYFVELELNAISSRTSLYVAKIVNTSDSTQTFSMKVGGKVFDGLGEAEKFTDGWLFKVDKKEDVFWLLRFRLDSQMELNYSTVDYEFSFKQMQPVAPGDTLRIVAVISQYFKGDNKQEVMLASEALENPLKYLNKTVKMWDYLIRTMKFVDLSSKELSIKSLETLYLNLRGYLPGFTNFNIMPGTGMSTPYFNVEESWLIASSLVIFDKNIAKHQLASILSSKNPDGSINKYITTDKDRPVNSQLNEKPMLAWTAWNIYLGAVDGEFLKSIFPMIEDYHNYWYSYHDVNKNLWCENNDGIESVEINAMLFTEKYCLKNMAKMLGDSIKANMYSLELDSMKAEFNKYFFDSEKMQYCDFDLKTNTKVVTEDVFGYCLWSGLANRREASAYAAETQYRIENGYYTKLFADGNFDIGYYFFMITGLKLYKYTELSDTVKNQLLAEQYKTYKTSALKSYNADEKAVIENSSLTAAVLLLLLNY